jgi:hypothetical protein
MAYFSRFGGLWIDNTDAAQVSARIAGFADAELRERLRRFARDGYVVLPGAVPHQAIDTYLAQYRALCDLPGGLRLEAPWGRGYMDFSAPVSREPGCKVLDTAMLLPAGQDLCFAPAIAGFLEALFDGKALAFQSLHFEVGSRQAVHQDTAYVVVDREPLKLAASWIALEDIHAGTGELVYFVGGHRMAEYVYGAADDGDAARKHFNPERDGGPAHDRHLRYLIEESERAGFREERFLARKGDALIWHAELPHGGATIAEAGSTRRALVTHYCPKSLSPYYIHWIPQEWRHKSPAAGDHAFLSLFYPPSRFAGPRPVSGG